MPSDTSYRSRYRPELDLAALEPTANDLDPLGLKPLPADNRRRYLRFVLDGKDDALLALRQISEVMQIGLEEIFPVPDMPACILGVCSWRAETLWLVDLNHLTGHEPLYRQSRTTATAMAIVVQFAGRSLGLVVEQVGDVDLFEEETIHKEPGLCSPGLEPFVLGYCREGEGIVLDAAAIVDAPIWQSHGEVASDR